MFRRHVSTRLAVWWRCRNRALRSRLSPGSRTSHRPWRRGQSRLRLVFLTPCEGGRKPKANGGGDFSQPNPPLTALASPLHRGAKNRAHFFLFFAFLERPFFEGEATGFALTSTAATMHGSLPRTLQEWLVPRCTRTSPGRSSFSPVSITA